MLHATSRSHPISTSDRSARITVANAVEESEAPRAAKDDYLDQLITWRELSINFVSLQPESTTLSAAGLGASDAGAARP